MKTFRSFLLPTFPAARRRHVGLVLALGCGLGLDDSHAGTPGARTPSEREGLRQALAHPPPLPAGVAPALPTADDGAASLPSLVADPAAAEQRLQALHADLKTIVAVERLPAVGTVEFIRLRADALAIVQRHHRESRAALEPDAVGEFSRCITWTPDFSPAPRPVAPADRETARVASYAVAHAVTHLDRPRFVVAYATAILALDPDSPLGAENAASAIVTGGERRLDPAVDAAELKACREDAAVVYRYALAGSVVDAQWTLRSLGILINLGNLYVDLNRPELARPVLLAARAFSPTSWDAALGLASCYLRQGRPDLARAALEDQAVARSALYAATAKGSTQLDAIRAGGDVSAESAEADFEAALKALEGRETMTAADFAGLLAPEERDRMRRFVDHLPVQGSYRAPAINELTQFSTLQSISTPAGFRALGDFNERLGALSLKMFGYMMQGQHEALARLGLKVKFDVDIDDVMANPERYKNRSINASVSGVEELKARVGAMKLRAQQMKRNVDAGNMAALLTPSPMAVAANPILAIHALKPFEYANPTDVLMQQYNASVLGRKLQIYNLSFFATAARTRAALAEIRERHAMQYAEIRAREDLATAELDRKRAAAAKAGQDVNSPYWRLLAHNLHRQFLPQYNARAEFAWKEATQVAAKAYSDRVKPRAERCYYDVLRHIALISDPAVRERKNREFEQILMHGVYTGLVNVLQAFGSSGYAQEWDCHCDVGSLQADAEREKQEMDRVDAERHARDQQARLRFASGEIPPASPLFQKLDAYGTDLDIPFIPLLTGRISCARSTFSLAGQLPTAIGAKGNYTFTQSAFTGATTHAGGVEVSVSAKSAPLSPAATLNVRGSVTQDGQGVVTDYTVTAASTVKAGLGPVSGMIGAEIGYTPAGGLISDVSGGLTAVLNGAYGRTVQVTIEGSARRGSTFSAKAEQNLNPYSSEINGFLKDVTKDQLGEKFPFNTDLKAQLWNGKFAF